MRIALIISIVACYSSIHAQDTFRMESYLATALTDQSLERYHSQLNFLEGNNYNSPWLNRVELRVGSEDANASLNEYRVRLSPTNPAEIKANKVYHAKQVNVINTQRKIAISDALTNRYRLIIDLAYLLGAQQLLQERISFQNQLNESIGKGGDKNFNLKDIISIQADQSKHLLKQEEIETSIAQTLYFIELDYKGTSSEYEPLSDLIGIEQIKGYIDRILEQSEMPSLKAQALKSVLELDRQELKIDAAESRSNIGYIQSNIDTERGNELNERIGFQVGVRIPIVNPDKPSLNRKKVKLLEEEAKTESRLSLLDEKQKLNDMLLQRLLDRYQIMLERIEISEAIPVSSINQVEWSQIIALKNYQLQLLEDKVETEKLIREAYIDFLNGRGMLVGTPIINYLSKSFNIVEPTY